MGKSTKTPDSKQQGSSITLYIDNDIIEEFSKDAKDQRRSKSFIANEILRKYYIEQDRIKPTT